MIQSSKVATGGQAAVAGLTGVGAGAVAGAEAGAGVPKYGSLEA